MWSCSRNNCYAARYFNFWKYDEEGCFCSTGSAFVFRKPITHFAHSLEVSLHHLIPSSYKTHVSLQNFFESLTETIGLGPFGVDCMRAKMKNKMNYSDKQISFRWVYLHIKHRNKHFEALTLSWQTSLSYRNQFINLRTKSMDWFLYDSYLRHERVKFVW